MESEAFFKTPLGLLCLCFALNNRNDEFLADLLTDAHMNWSSLLRLAGNHLVTPSLASVLQRHGLMDRLPSQVSDYLQTIQALNQTRNATLRAQLTEIVGELNGIGLTPLLIKGALALFPDQYPSSVDRVMGDLDIVLPEDGLLPAQALLSRLGYKADVEDFVWHSARERQRHHHLPPMQHCSLPVSVELHHRLLHSTADHALLHKNLKPEMVLYSDGGRVLVPDPTSRLVHSFLHSQVSHQLGTRRLVNIRNLLEFAMMAQHYRDDISIDGIKVSVRTKRLYELAEYWAVAEAWLGAAFPARLARSPRQKRELWLTARTMTDPKWRKVFTISFTLRNLPPRLWHFGWRIWERPEYFPTRVGRLIREGK